ncbi:MAG: ferrous iron transporter B, partial [Christensenellaceae bacterium]|nr:ferrous iron transporter B [Christensenellaceae bacterium]
MGATIALAGNPNSGKTTLFNALTGSNQFVGNWPGVTVEKKEGRLRGHRDVTIVDLPGIYSLSPYTLEELVARNYLTDERPDAVLNIVDGTNLERNLFLTTQLIELGIPVVVALNMMDLVRKRGDQINAQRLAEELGCRVIEISALKSENILEAAAAAVQAAQGERSIPRHGFSGCVEHALAHIEESLCDLPEARRRFFAIKLFERDEKIIAKLKIAEERLARIEEGIRACEKELDDDSESIVTAERYAYIDSIIRDCVKIRRSGLSASDKIDRVVTNRWLALPIFALVMFLVYYVSVTTVGGIATDWANDGVFGDGWHLFGIGAAAYEEAAGEFDLAQAKIDAFLEAAGEAGIDAEPIRNALEEGGLWQPAAAEILGDFSAQAAFIAATAEIEGEDGASESAVVDLAAFLEVAGLEGPDPASYGVWVPGVPALLAGGLEAVGCAEWLQGLILDGIVAGVGAVLGFVPQMLILFIFLAFLEACGYMARIAFIMDRIFRRFGLSGKSFIPILIGTGCGVPGIMASRTIESQSDRRMTIMTTTFIPCSAKLPIIALIAGALFNGAAWIAPSAYFAGMAAIVCSGVILKKTKLFAGGAAPFVMELPAYHWPTPVNILRSMWERGWSFIKKAGTIILLATI